MKVCFDTQIIVWGIRETATAGQEEQITHARRLRHQLRARGDRVIVPAIVIGELLLDLPTEHHALTMNLFDEAYEIVPFDLGCAGRFAALWKQKKESGLVDRIISEERATRQELRADCLIVATAAQHGVELLYSNDRKLRRFAEGEVEARELPLIEEQQEMFDADAPTAQQDTAADGAPRRS